MTPFVGSTGLDGLTRSLASAFGEHKPPEDLESKLREIESATDAEGGTQDARRSLRRLSNDLLIAHGCTEGHVLLVLDQLEEVFGSTPGSQAHLMLRLLEVTAEHGSPVVVLATLRSDFLNSFQLFPGAAKRYEEVTLDPMLRARFGELIAKPAERFGLRLAAGLTERLVEDTRYDDALPLLAFTLRELYEKGGADGVLTLKEYEELFPPVQVRAEDGATTEYRGVSATIKHAADRILAQAKYLQLPADDPRMRDLRRAFYSLARVGEAGQFTRRTALWSKMPASCEEVLKRFVQERLLVAGAEDGERTLSVAHEALFRVWDTLRGWLLQDRKALALRGQIEEAAAEGEAEHRAASRQWLESAPWMPWARSAAVACRWTTWHDRRPSALFSARRTRRRYRSCLSLAQTRTRWREAAATATPGACLSPTRHGRAWVYASPCWATAAAAWDCGRITCRTSTGAGWRAAR